MSRVLVALHCYICAFDEDCFLPDRKRQPLRKACLGRCFLVPIILSDRKCQLSGFDLSFF
ncbi:unnamed protein product [Gongylonema pulchrum]|uniref:Uncharacterized protein n=1 Tax=Gongylonema pulchrum TaxID=637853 RepID=A0A183DGY5_9BILA|nr:unnamed protein product [Gongylonema pulchrum]